MKVVKRVTFRDKEKKSWANWLPKDLGKRLDQIKKLTTHLLNTKENEVHLQFYTPHGDEHCRAVEDNLHRLIPGKLHKKLSEAEKFFLLSSAWLHDLGMLRGLDQQSVSYSDEEIRDYHHILSEKFIVGHYREVGVEETEAATLGLLARFHRRRCHLQECPEYLTVPEHGTIRLQLLAAYLRLADSLHIDQSRVPDNLYAISLTYNIPTKSKLHWLRSKFVLGVEVDTYKKEIITYLKYPTNPDTISSNVRKPIKRTLNSIYNLIVEDLNEELNSVKNILFSENISYFLRVKKEIYKVEFDKKLVQDVRSVINYYHLFDNPSSSALINLILESIDGILMNEDTLFYKSNTSDLKILDDVKKLIYDIESNVTKKRSRHTGIVNLLENANKIIEKGSVNELRRWVEKEEMSLKAKRRALRSQSFNYFNENKIDNQKEKYNILLYGYSELVMKSICGFRDYVIVNIIKDHCEKIDAHMRKKIYPGVNKKILKSKKNHKYMKKFMETGEDPRGYFTQIPLFHKEYFEDTASKSFRIFCCEGQPKNHTSPSGRLLHHDGSSFALSLAERGFNEIYVIPDAIAGSLVSRFDRNNDLPRIDYVFIGANGFENKYFQHSAGHSMIISLAQFAKYFNSCDTSENKISGVKKPIVILSLMDNKYGELRKRRKDNYNKRTDKVVVNDGWKFLRNFDNEVARYHSFFTQDQEVKRALGSFGRKVLIYNPREDQISFDHVDVVLTENGFLKNDDTGKKITGKKILNLKKTNKRLRR